MIKLEWFLLYVKIPPTFRVYQHLVSNFWTCIHLYNAYLRDGFAVLMKEWRFLKIGSQEISLHNSKEAKKIDRYFCFIRVIGYDIRIYHKYISFTNVDNLISNDVNKYWYSSNQSLLTSYNIYTCWLPKTSTNIDIPWNPRLLLSRIIPTSSCWYPQISKKSTTVVVSSYSEKLHVDLKVWYIYSLE